MFWGKKDEKADDSGKKAIHSAEYEDLLVRFVKISKEVELLTNKFEIFKIGLDDLRGKFSRKLKGLEPEAVSKPEEKIEKDLNDVFVGFG